MRDKYAGRFVYHGTRYPSAIIASDRLNVPDYGDRHVSLTRNFDVAVYWASMERDDDEGCGSVFIIDRKALEATYSLKSFVSAPDCKDEHEEACTAAIEGLSRYVVAEVPV